MTVEGVLDRVLSAPSPFCRDRLVAAGVTRVATDVLRRLPLTRRTDLLRDQLAHLPLGTRRYAGAAAPVRAAVAGSGDELLVLAWSADDLAWERAAGVRLLDRVGVRAGMRIANVLPGALATPGALLLGDVVEELGGLDVPLGPVAADAAARQAWEMIDRVEPDVLVLDAASGAVLLAAAPARARSWWHGILWLRGVVASAVPVPAAAGFTGWQRHWLTVPEVASFVAHSCTADRFHVDDGVLAEVVDATSGALAADGILALTPLGGESPVLRYASGVRAHAADGCACGASGTVIEVE